MYFLKSMNQIHIFHQKLKCHRQCPPLGATSGDLNNRKVKQQTFFFFLPKLKLSKKLCTVSNYLICIKKICQIRRNKHFKGFSVCILMLQYILITPIF